MKMNKELYEFIKEYCEHSWRRDNNKFYIWIPLQFIEDFVKLVDFNIFEYEYIEDCWLSEDLLGLELTYFIDNIEDYFSKERRLF